MDERLDSVTKTALNKVFEKWSVERLSKCFPAVETEILKQGHEMCREYVIENVLEKYEEWKKLKSIDEKLNLLQTLMDNYPDTDKSAESSSFFDPATEPNPEPIHPMHQLKMIQTDALNSELTRIRNEISSEEEKQKELLEQYRVKIDVIENQLKPELETLKNGSLVGGGLSGAVSELRSLSGSASSNSGF